MNKIKVTIGFSPCPNDTFIFGALINGRIDTDGLEFDYFMADVEELNRRAFVGKDHILKLSYHAYAHASKDYLILDSGGALGYGTGPLLVSKREISESEVASLKIAIPGRFTTANLLFSIKWPDASNKKEYLFSDIEDAIIADEVDAGIIIHESRFTYFRKGLRLFTDLGRYWEEFSGLPVPLGAIAVNRSVPEEIAKKINSLIVKSLNYAHDNPDFVYDFIRKYAKVQDAEVISSHINLYVNEFTLNLGAEGKKAVRELYRKASEAGVIPALPQRIFLSEKDE